MKSLKKKKNKHNNNLHMPYETAKKTRQAEPHLSGDADNNSWHVKLDLLIQPICKTTAIHQQFIPTLHSKHAPAENQCQRAKGCGKHRMLTEVFGEGWAGY